MFIPPLNQKFIYEQLVRIDGEERLYQTTSGNLPSVTTILSATDSEEDKQGLANWRSFVGSSKADEIVQEACTIGSLMHENLENRLSGIPDNMGSMPIRALARRMADVIQENAWPHINEIWGMEAQLYYHGLWAGTTDLVGLHDGVPAIMDYKNSRSIKEKSKIHNYFMQGCAYALAHNQLHGTDIQKVVIFICVRKDPKNLMYQEFIIEGDEFNYFKNTWINRVAEFYKLRGII